MPHCIVIGAGEVGLRALARADIRRDDFIIAADGGYLRAAEVGLVPDVILGDFDSAPEPDDPRVIKHPTHKDDTDTLLAIKAGLERGYNRFILLGATGGRLDHTLANIQALLYMRDCGAGGYILDEQHAIRVLQDETWSRDRYDGYLSLFAMTGDCLVTVSGVEYPLENHWLVSSYPLGVSNRITELQAVVRVHSGTLLVVEAH